MNHAQSIEKYRGSFDDLGEDITGLSRDTLIELFSILTEKFDKDALHDLELKHPRVSVYLKNISNALG
jgi:hypothetical protein